MKKLLVKVKIGVSHPEVECIDETNYVVRVCERAHNGQANAAVIKALAAYFGCAQSRFTIRRGFQSKQKLIELL